MCMILSFKIGFLIGKAISTLFSVFLVIKSALDKYIEVSSPVPK